MARAYGLEAITVIPHGIPLPPLVPTPPGKIVLSIGGMSSRKGMRYLIDAIPAILHRVPEATFKIVGIDGQDPAVELFRNRHAEAAKRVHFLGAVSAERLGELYDECALYVSPSIYESFGLTFLEAMSHGRPVIGCATSAMPEIVDHGVTGILVAPRSETALAGAITHLLLDDDARAAMGAAARRAASGRFSLDLIAERIERFFAGVIENAESGPPTMKS
jgi:glycosyltransferase involved in cell wall biosynthesis